MHLFELHARSLDLLSSLLEDVAHAGGHDGDRFFKMTPGSLGSVDSPLCRDTLVYMSPDDFLAMAEGGQDNDKAATVRKVLKKGVPFSSLPYLGFLHDGKGHAKVIAHEGRHRARALKALGVREIPVILRSQEGGVGKAIRWGSQHRPTDRVDPFPQTLKGEDGRATIPMPRSVIFPQVD